MSRDFLIYNFNGRTDAKHYKRVNLSLNLTAHEIITTKRQQSHDHEIFISDESC